MLYTKVNVIYHSFSMAEPSQAFIDKQKSGEFCYPISFFNFRLNDDPESSDTETRRYSRKGYAARLVHSVLRSSGFTECEKYDDANLIWGGPIEESQYNKLKLYQRLTHYNKTFSLGSKSGYNKMMKNFTERIGEYPKFYPLSFQLPEERKELERISHIKTMDFQTWWRCKR